MFALNEIIEFAPKTKDIPKPRPKTNPHKCGEKKPTEI
jgi:hypothetical protein